MNDLISRQAAIDAIRKMQTYKLSADANFLLVDQAEVMTELMLLPPSKQVIHCKDCEWWAKQDKSLQGRCELMQMYPTGEWFCGNAQKKVENGRKNQNE